MSKVWSTYAINMVFDQVSRSTQAVVGSNCILTDLWTSAIVITTTAFIYVFKKKNVLLVFHAIEPFVIETLDSHLYCRMSSKSVVRQKGLLQLGCYD